MGGNLIRLKGRDVVVVEWRRTVVVVVVFVVERSDGFWDVKRRDIVVVVVFGSNDVIHLFGFLINRLCRGFFLFYNFQFLYKLYIYYIFGPKMSCVEYLSHVHVLTGDGVNHYKCQ